MILFIVFEYVARPCANAQRSPLKTLPKHREQRGFPAPRANRAGGSLFLPGPLRVGILFLATTLVAPLPCKAVQARRPSETTSPARSSARNAALVNRARKLVQDGDAQGALSVLEQADLRAANAADVHALKGTCMALLAKPVESAEEFDAAIALHPLYAPTYFSAGLASASFNNLDRALERLAMAVKLDPSLPRARYTYALVLARAGQFAASEQQADLELNTRLGRSETDLEIWRLKARDAYFQHKWQDTADSFNKVLALDPNNAEAYADTGEAFFSLNRTDEGLRALKKAEFLDPENGLTHALLGKLYQDTGKTQPAIAEFEAADRSRPNDQDVIFRLARLYKQSGDTLNANRRLQQLKDLLAAQNNQSMNEAKATELNNAGVELAANGDLSGALDQFDKAARADVTNVIFQRNAALILCRLGRAEEAIRRLRDILAVDPDEPESLQILAVANEMAAARSGTKPALPQVKLAQ